MLSHHSVRVSLQIWCMVSPEKANTDISKGKTWVTFSLTWAYMISQQLWVVFLLVVFCSRLGGMKLGKESDEPEYPAASWFMMMFSAGAARGVGNVCGVELYVVYVVSKVCRCNIVAHASSFCSQACTSWADTSRGQILRALCLDHNPKLPRAELNVHAYAAGIGIGLFFFGVAEPIIHYEPCYGAPFSGPDGECNGNRYSFVRSLAPFVLHYHSVALTPHFIE